MWQHVSGMAGGQLTAELNPVLVQLAAELTDAGWTQTELLGQFLARSTRYQPIDELAVTLRSLLTPAWEVETKSHLVRHGTDTVITQRIGQHVMVGDQRYGRKAVPDL